MYRTALVVGTLAVLLTAAHLRAAITDATAWINEFHYENVGADTGEFIEVVVHNSFTDLTQFEVRLYNGADNEKYGTIQHLEDFTPGDTVAGFTIYSKGLSDFQNGSPDGLALVHDTLGLLQFLSYEGTFTVDDPGDPVHGVTSTDVGVQESGSTPEGYSLQLAGIGDSYFDFHNSTGWQAPLPATPGQVNTNQQIVPEPNSLALWGLPLALGMWRQSRCSRRPRRCPT